MKKMFVLIPVFFYCACSVNAQVQNSSRMLQPKVPVLNGHQFPSTTYLKSSFTNTSLQADLGFGSTSQLSIPGIKIGDIEILDFEGSILFFNMSVQYQQRFTPWLALFTSLEFGGRVGSDVSTILVDGVNTLASGKIGWLVRIKQTERFNLSGSVALNNTSGSFLNLSQYLEDLINGVPDASVSNSVPAMTVSVGLQGAYAFSPTFGLQFDGKYAYGEALARGKSAGYLSAGFVGDVNFYPRCNLPIGLALGYGVSSIPEIVMGDDDISNFMLGKLFYTGSDDFEIGLQYTYYNVNIESVGHKPFISKALLTLKFYF